MRLLILGGSWFLGPALVSAARQRGWEIWTFSRGRVSPPAGVTAVFGDREKAADLARLAEHGPWDVVVDVAGVVPAVVASSADMLCGLVDRYVLMSTISAYQAWPHAPVDEASRVWQGDPEEDPGTRVWDPEAYGPLKVGCEVAAERAFGGDRLLVFRPHVILGPGEYVGRLPWWLARASRGGRVLVPGPDRLIQPIDVRDVASFVCDQVEREASGVFNLAGPHGRDSFGDLVSACVETVESAAQRPAELVWVDEDWLVGQGVTQWTEIPLWRNAAAPWDMDVARAQTAGLRCRPLVETVADTWSWLQSGGRAVEHERAAEHGLDPGRERSLLEQWERLVR